MANDDGDIVIQGNDKNLDVLRCSAVFYSSFDGPIAYPGRTSFHSFDMALKSTETEIKMRACHG